MDAVSDDSSSQLKELRDLLARSEFFSSHLSKRLEGIKQNKKVLSVPNNKEEALENAGFNIDKNDENSISVANCVNEVGAEKTVTSGKTVNEPKVETKQSILLEGGELRDYQLYGVNWMSFLFQNGMSGILADEMGLGKTIQVIGFFCHLYEKLVDGPFLVVAPLSTLRNWFDEFSRFAPKLPVILFHGNAYERQCLKKEIESEYELSGRLVLPVVLTSYEIAMREVLLSRIFWKYLVVDEGHRLKNHNSLLSRTLSFYQKGNCLLLTGTPLQNNLTELWALLNFIIPHVFDNMATFENILALQDIESEGSAIKLIEKEKGASIITTLHKILKPFMLRRVKSDVCLELPSKQEKVVYCPITEEQMTLYSSAVNQNMEVLLKSKKKEDLIIPEGPNGEKPKRKSIRPVKYLEEFYEEEEEDQPPPQKRRMSFSSEKSEVSTDSTRAYSEASMDGYKLLSIRDRTIEPPKKKRRMSFSSEKSEVSTGSARAYSEASMDGYRLLSMRDRTTNVFHMAYSIHFLEFLQGFKGFSEEEIQESAKRPRSSAKSLSFLEGFKGFGEETRGFPEDLKLRKWTDLLMDYDDFDFSGDSSNYSESIKSDQITDDQKTEYLVQVKMSNIGMMLRKISNHPYLVHMPLNKDKTMKCNEDIVKKSGKMIILNQLLMKLQDTSHKVVIFSNFTSMLNILECFLTMKRYKYVRLDGSVNIDLRREAIQQFNTDNETFIFLISTRAGGLGINLTVADTVILFDSDWNPQVDLQAQDRCHRIGQKNPVLVLRLISKGTIEEKMLSRASSKLTLEKLVILKGRFRFLNNTTQDTTDLRELQELLDSSTSRASVQMNKYGLEESEIHELLSRNS